METFFVSNLAGDDKILYCRCTRENDLIHTDKCQVHSSSVTTVNHHLWGGRKDCDNCYYCGFLKDDKIHQQPWFGTSVADQVMEELMEGQHDKLNGKKHDGGKPPMALLSSDALFEVAKVLEFGAQKYDAWNWKGGFKWVRIASAVLRHIFQWLRGEDKDPETGLSHLSHAICGLMFLVDFEVNKLGEDDRWKPSK